MKTKIFFLILFLFCISVKSQNTPVIQTLTGAATLTCPQDNTLTLQSSEVDFNYYLRNDADNSIVDGPISGTGNALNFSTGLVNTSTTYHVLAESTTNKALDFDGVDDYVETCSAVIPASGDFSVTFWVKRNSSTFSSNNEHFFAQGTGSAGTFLGIIGTSGEIRAGNDWQNTGVTFPADTNWHHLALVKTDTPGSSSNSDVYLYIDGVFVASQTVMPYNNPAQEPFRIARQYEPHQEYLNGQMDQLTVWDKALSAAEVIETQTQNYSGTESNLISYFNFNDGTGTTLTNNVSGNTNNGTLNNMDPTDWVAGKSGIGTIVSNTQTITFNNPAIVYVDATATGNNTGCDWANAYTNVQDAVNRVAVNGQVLIATGNYKQGTEITINKILTLKGGYPTGGGTQDITNNPTILDGNDAHRVLLATHTSGTLHIEGLTIQNGKISGNTSGKGAGVYTIGSITFNSVKIIGNEISSSSSSSSSKSYGGGVYTINGSITLINSTVSNNTISSSSFSSSESYGGGIYAKNGSITLTNTTLSNNTISSISYSSSTSSYFSFSESYGGGIYTESGNITLINSQVNNSSATSFSSSALYSGSSSYGGGLYLNFGSATLINSQVSNSSTSSTTTSSSSSSSSFSSFSYGGGLYTKAGSSTLINSQVTKNSSSSSSSSSNVKGGGVYGIAILKNSILWNNTKSTDGGTTFTANEHEEGSLTTNYSLIKNQNPTGIANIDATATGFNPLFVDEANGDYRLQIGSPLINAGNNSYLPLDVNDLDNDGNTTEIIPSDLDGLDRIIDITVDIGPYENQDSNTLTINNTNLRTITIYPNPVNNEINIIGLTTIADYSIYTLLGQKVLSSKLEVNGKINVSKLVSGIYFLKLNESTIKFVKN